MNQLTQINNLETKYNIQNNKNYDLPEIIDFIITDELSYKISKLEKYYLENTEFFRKRQKEAFLGFINFLKNGGKSGLIKLPTGTGKTFLIKHIIKALGVPSMTLVPRTNLVKSTFYEFERKNNINGLNNFFLDGKDSRKGNVSEQLEQILKKGGTNFNLVLTYQSLLKIKQDNPKIYNLLKSKIGLIISDEAHRGLGDSTKSAIEGLKNEEIEIKNDFESNGDIFHLHTTATRALSNKVVDEDIIYSSTFIDVVKDGDLVFPTQNYSIGKAFVKTNSTKDNSKNYEQYLDKYCDIDGEPIYKKITQEYLKQKELNGGYLPSVAFCNTTNQVEEYVKYLESIGVRAIQCTTNKSGTNYVGVSDAERLLEDNKADIVVSCTKIGEGWDLPTLRGVLWLTPSSSSARIIQGTGRITRILLDKISEKISNRTGIDKKYITKTSKNTMIFSPSSWEFINLKNQKSINEESSYQTSYTCLEAFVEEGEIDIDDFKKLGIEYKIPEKVLKKQLEKQKILDYFSNKLKITNITELFLKGDFIKDNYLEFEIGDGEKIDFENIIGSKNINFDVTTSVGIKNMKKLGEYLGFDFNKIIDEYLFYLSGQLINDMKSLNSGIARTHIFYNTIILGKKFTPTKSNISQLAFNLGYFEKVDNLKDYIKEYKSFLEIYGVDSIKSLESYKGSLSIEKCSNIIGEYFSPKSKKHMEMLGNRLGFE